MRRPCGRRGAGVSVLPRSVRMMLVVDCPGVSGTTTTLAAPRAHLRRADDGVLGVVAAFHEDVGMQTLRSSSSGVS